jgi:hypothetical protein
LTPQFPARTAPANTARADISKAGRRYVPLSHKAHLRGGARSSQFLRDVLFRRRSIPSRMK